MSSSSSSTSSHPGRRSLRKSITRLLPSPKHKKKTPATSDRVRPPAEISPVRAAFDLFDSDRDGCITATELAEFALRACPNADGEGAVPPPSKLIAGFSKLDLDHNGSIEFEEFEKGLAELSGREETWREVFNQWDLDNSGAIDVDEMVELMGKFAGPQVTRHEAEEMVRALDTNGDGYVDFEEFKAMVMGQDASDMALPPPVALRTANRTTEELRAAFDLFDKDHDGCITASELEDVVTTLAGGDSTCASEMMVALVDLDRNGVIEFEEFENFMMRRWVKAASPADGYRDVFKMFDTDGNGTISADELQEMMAKFGQETSLQEAEAMIRSADLNGDGRLDFNEFQTMMQV